WLRHLRGRRRRGRRTLAALDGSEARFKGGQTVAVLLFQGVEILPKLINLIPHRSNLRGLGRCHRRCCQPSNNDHAHEARDSHKPSEDADVATTMRPATQSTEPTR